MKAQLRNKLNNTPDITKSVQIALWKIDIWLRNWPILSKVTKVASILTKLGFFCIGNGQKIEPISDEGKLFVQSF